MIQAFIDIDKWLFLLINGLNNPTLDGIMHAISDKWIWIPLYLFLLVLLVRKFKFQSLYLIFLIGILIVLCDQLSVHLFKNLIMRLRPCHEPTLQNMVHIVNDHCGGQYGFVSSHATNVFGLAFFLGTILKQVSKYWMIFLIIWAVVVSYSRIYLGVHYPFDVICGGILGVTLAQIVLLLLKVIVKKFTLNLIEI